MSDVDLKFLDDTLKNIGSNLVSFYHGVITDDNDDKETKRALRQLRKKYSQKLRNNDTSSISFESLATRNAYLFQYCPSFTGAVASSFAKFIKGMPNYASELCSKDSITVCCLGGGPGTELVAIYFVLKDILLNNPLKNGTQLLVNTVIVDVDPGWAETSARVVSKLQELADASYVKIKFKFSFMVYDVTLPMTQEVGEVLKTSDIVTMVKFLSAIHGPNTADVRSTIVRGVCDLLPQNSLLFSMDSSGWKNVDEIRATIDACEKMTLVYGIKKNWYRLSKASKSLCLSLYSGRYGTKYCTLCSFNKTAVWLKRAQEENEVDAIVKLSEVLKIA